MTVEHIKWPSIENFHNVFKSFHMNRDMQKTPNVHYAPKIKLHGTNAAVQFDSDTNSVYAQKRTGLITPENDNAGFATWVELHKESFYRLFHRLWWIRGDGSFQKKIILHGEWAGPGIQKNTVLNEISMKIFAIFAIEELYDNGDHILNSFVDSLYDPLEELDKEGFTFNDQLYTLDFLGGVSYNINFYDDREKIEAELEKINSLVKDVEKCDPWVYRLFGKEGVGEGVVLYPCGFLLKEGEIDSQNHNQVTQFMFKAKGEEHRVAKDKVSVRIDPELLRKNNEFADKFVTEARCLQAVQEACSGEYDIRKMSNFLKWLVSDIYKESKDELVASQLEWKPISSACTSAASAWYKKKCYTL